MPEGHSSPHWPRFTHSRQSCTHLSAATQGTLTRRLDLRVNGFSFNDEGNVTEFRRIRECSEILTQRLSRSVSEAALINEYWGVS